MLEASGVAEPSAVALTFLANELRDRIRFDSIICTIDAEQIFASRETMELKLRQIAFADISSFYWIAPGVFGDRAAGDGYPLGSRGFSLVLAKEVAISRRQAKGAARNSPVDP